MPIAKKTAKHKVAPHKQHLIKKDDFLKSNLNFVSDFSKNPDLFQAIFDNAPFHLGATDKEGYFIVWNAISEKMFGYTKNEVIGKLKPEVLHRNKKEAMEVVERTLEEGSFHEEVILKHKNGEHFPAMLYINVIKDKLGSINCLLGTAIDLSKEKKIEKEREISENAYKTIFENTGTATIIVDENMIISLVNDQFVGMSGYNKNEIVNKKKWSTFFIEEDVKKMEEFHTLRRIDPRLAPRNYEAHLIDRRGNIKNVYLTVAMIPGTKKSVASFLDITPLKAIENELMISKKLFDDLVEGTPVAMFVINTDHKIVYWNNELEKMTGFKASQMIGTSYHWKPFYKKESQMMTDMIIDGVKFGDILKLERYRDMEIEESNAKDRIICSSYFENSTGKKRWIRFVIKPLYDTQNNLIGAIETVEDLTDYKNTRDSLKNRMREFHVLYLVNDHIRMLDSLKKVLKKVTKDLILACDEIKPARSRVIFDDKIYTNLKKDEKFIRKIQEYIIILGKKRGSIELGYITKIDNKESFSMEYEKKVLRIIVSTLSRHIQHREIVKRYRKLVDKSVVGIFIAQDGSFKYVNPKFTRMFKLKSKDIIGNECGDLIRRCASGCISCTFNRGTHFTTKAKRYDGKEIDVEVFTQVIDYYGKKAILGTVQDVTRLKNAQERQKNFNLELKLKISEKTADLEKANHRLQSLNELKDEFIAVTSHELRSPLTAARGYLSFLAEDEIFKKMPEQTRNYFMRVYDNVEILNNLINNILDVSRIDLGRFELHLKSIDIIDLVKQSIKSFSFQANEKELKINFINKLDKEFFILSVDQVRILQVLRNILDNAIKYSYKGKEINVEIHTKGIGVEISISDYGMGIRKSEIFAIFDKFKQAKNTQAQYKGGAGLGLFIAKKIIELHNGMIWVESQLNKGTVFRIQLPL